MNEPEPLNPFERQLARALRPVDVPAKLTRSLLLAAEAEERRSSAPTHLGALAAAKVWTLPKAPAWASGGMAALLLLGALAGDQVHVRHHRQQAQLAQQQFDTALRVTDQALDQTRQQLERAGLRFQ